MSDTASGLQQYAAAAIQNLAQLVGMSTVLQLTQGLADQQATLAKEQRATAVAQLRKQALAERVSVVAVGEQSLLFGKNPDGSAFAQDFATFSAADRAKLLGLPVPSPDPIALSVGTIELAEAFDPPPAAAPAAPPPNAVAIARARREGRRGRGR